jgi:putative effector of murein hydrolase
MYNRGLMNPLLLGVLCGVVFDVADALMMVFGNHPDLSRSMLMRAFASPLAIGVWAQRLAGGWPGCGRSIDRAADQPA